MITELRHRRAFAALTVLACLTFTASTALADRVVLRAGAEMRGAVANRERLALDPDAVSEVGVLVEGEGGITTLQHIAVSDIAYIVLEDPSGTRVIEFSSRHSDSAPPGQPVGTLSGPMAMSRVRNTSSSTSGAGVLLAIVGAGAAVFGAVHKFGDAKATITESSISVDETSYDARNYALIAGGGVLFLIGLISATTGGSDRGGSRHGSFTTPGSPGVGLAYALTF